MEIDIGRLCYDADLSLSEEDSYLFRGYIANRFSQYDIVHNHSSNTGKLLYRYPLLQYKVLHQRAVIISVGPVALRVFKEIFAQIDELIIGRHRLTIRDRAWEITREPFGIAELTRHYRFLSPWMALNQKNFAKYKQLDPQGKQDLLSHCLVGNLLSMSTSLRYRVLDKIRVRHRLSEKSVLLKGQNMLGFVGTFAVNFHIPDFLGLGKSCSRGFGSCVAMGYAGFDYREIYGDTKMSENFGG